MWRAALVLTTSLVACGQPTRPRTAPQATAPGRTLTFTNQCGFDVWVQSVGSNAANLPCSPSTTSAQANCPSGFLCYQANANTQYCVPGTTQATTFPITDPSQVTLDAAACPSGTLVTSTASAQWGQCTCAGTSGCPANQVCGQIDSTTSQCFWGFALPDGGHLAAGATGTIDLALSSSDAAAIVASGNFFAQLSCDDNGNCLSNSVDGAPATRIEYTLANDKDFYDVSYINGMNVPAVMTPVLSTNLAYASSDPYACTAAGGDAATLQAIATFQRKNGLDGNTALQAFACTNNYDTTFTGDLVGLNFVSATASPTPCTAASDCTGGTVCGLTLAAVTGTGTGQLTCGQRLGYWSYAQLCAANAGFASTALGVACDDAQTLAYAQCTDRAGVADQGPGRSCFNSNTTSSGDTCCGFDAWTFGGKAQPRAVGQDPVAGVVTSFWTTNILPVVAPMKAGCPLAYSFQFDDPYATFTCATTGGGLNSASYDITLCPGGDAAGVNPPPPPTCTATVPSGLDADQFTVSPGSNVTVAIAACDATGTTCTTPVAPDGGTGTVYTTTSATLYQITATSSTGQQVCQFTIPADGCITRTGSGALPPCTTWVLGTTPPWTGRSIQVPGAASASTRPVNASTRSAVRPPRR